MRWRALGLAALAAAAAICAGVARSAPTAQPVWIVLVDRSLDSTADARLDGVKELRRAADAAIKSKGRVYAAGFADHALAQVEFDVSADFSKPPPGYIGSNPDLIRVARDARVGALVAKASPVILPNLGVKGSDMIGALLAAVRGPLGVAHGRVLIVLDSNMLEYSTDDRLFFTNLVPIRLVGTLDRLRSRGRIAKLNGACVVVENAGKIEDGALSTTRLLAVEKFWRAYFGRAHAKVVNYLSDVPETLHAPCA
jgi:hypothetical protein